MKPVKYNIKPGKYRHYKGNFYEVLGMALHSETLKKWWFTKHCTETAVSGYDRLPCGMKKWKWAASAFRASL